MKKAWSKMSRVISALLVLGMVASVVPAQALAEGEDPAVVVEQTEDVEQGGVSLLGLDDQDDTETCTITVEFHNCVNWYYDFPEWEHKVRTKTITIKESEAADYWNMSAAEFANAVVGDNSFNTADFWLAGQNQPVRSGDGENWTVELYVNIHAWDKVPENYTLTYEKGDPWNDNLVAEPLYRIQNMSKQVAVSYAFQNLSGKQNGSLAPGETLKTSLAVNGVAAAVFFVDVPEDSEIVEVRFSNGTKGVVSPIEELDPEQGAYDFTDDVAQAVKDGCTHAFYYTEWAGNESRWFKVVVKKKGDSDPEQEWVLSYDANGGEGSIAPVPAKESEEVTIADGAALSKKDCHFVNWQDKEGKTYNPGEKIYLHSDLTLYAQWEEDTVPTPTEATYTVKYYKDNTDAANLVGTETKTGKVGEGTEYTAGKYLPDGYAADKVTISGATTIGADESKNILNVVYGRRTDLSYTVKYIEDNTGKVLAGPDTVDGQTYGAEVTVYARDIGGYSLMSTNPQKCTIGTGDNTITFYYREIGADQPVVLTPSEPAAPVAPVTPVTPRTTTTTTVTAPAATTAPAAGDADEEEPVEEEVVEEEETPLAEEPAEEETITDEETPLAESASGWALLNLILAIVTVIGAVVLVIGYFAGYQTIWRLLSLIPAIGGVVAFFLTEDMSLPMAFVDSWTLLMVIIAVVQVVIAVMAMRDKEEEEDA